MREKILQVYLQLSGNQLHPVSEKILTTARALGENYRTQGLVFTEKLTGSAEAALDRTGLSEVLVFEGFPGFLPEQQAACLETLPRGEILLFPATPEGRALSALTAAVFHTGVTADCTALSFTEDGLLLQTRPAFGGSRMASIVTATARPQIASLRFASPVREPGGKTRVIRSNSAPLPLYPVCWVDRTEERTANAPVILAVGGGLRDREDLQSVELLARALGAELCCSRALVDRGWMPRARQIGLSGRSVSAELLITLGISGSLPFRAGLDRVRQLCVVDTDPDTPLMQAADTPILCDLYEILDAMN